MYFCNSVFDKMYFSRASLKNLKHKTWKGTLLRIGMTESQPEDPEFKHLLITVDEIKPKLRELYKESCAVVAAGKEFNNDLEKMCGLGLSEEVFKRETEFLSNFEVQVCTALRTIVKTDIITLDELIVKYKAAKLRFDSLHFKTVKKMRKNGIIVKVEEADNVMKAHSDLPALHEAYLAAKLEVSSRRDVILNTLKTMAKSSLEELQEISEPPHHQLYNRYFKERFASIAEMCSAEASKEEISLLVRGNTFSNHRTRPSVTLFRTGSGTLPGHQRKEMNVAGNNETKPFAGKQQKEPENVNGAELEIKNNLDTTTAADDNDVGAINVNCKHPQNPEEIN